MSYDLTFEFSLASLGFRWSLPPNLSELRRTLQKRRCIQVYHKWFTSAARPQSKNGDSFSWQKSYIVAGFTLQCTVLCNSTPAPGALTPQRKIRVVSLHLDSPSHAMVCDTRIASK
jgi:hypothetical protein